MTTRFSTTKLIALVPLLTLFAGCNTNPVADRAEIQRAKFVTVVCCDSPSDGAVVSGNAMYGGALLGLGGGLVGAAASRSAMAGTTDQRTQQFLEKAGRGPLKMPEEFARAVVDALKAKGVDAHLVFPIGFDGYNNRYNVGDDQVKGDLILEVRYAGQVVNYAERFFPTVAASLAVRSSKDRRTLNRAVLAAREPSIPAPSFGDANVLRAPMLVAFGPVANFRDAIFLDLTEQQVVKGDDAALFANAARLFDATSAVNRALASLLVSRVDQVKQ